MRATLQPGWKEVWTVLLEDCICYWTATVGTLAFLQPFLLPVRFLKCLLEELSPIVLGARLGWSRCFSCTGWFTGVSRTCMTFLLFPMLHLQFSPSLWKPCMRPSSRMLVIVILVFILRCRCLSFGSRASVRLLLSNPVR